jgi:NTP pyrophosphatase (non-canonical NTP hydrolase)
MTLDEYRDFVVGLASPNSTASFEAGLTTGGLGLAGEAGEVADVVKKIVFHGMDYTDEVRDRMIKELGDVMWYVAFTASVLDCSIDEIIDANVKKLQARYKGGKFSKEEFMKKELAKT